MFVHAREVDAPSNMKYMGLLVDKYVPDLARCKQSTWAGVAALSILILYEMNPAPVLNTHLHRQVAQWLENFIGSRAGVLAEQQDLRDQFQEYIIEPLLEAALPSPEVGNRC